jgi:hypothetical protein
MRESELQDAIDSLPSSIRPQRDLWPAINRRIESAEKTGRAPYKAPFWRTPAMAAAVLLALTSGIFIGRGMDGPGQLLDRLPVSPSTEPAGQTGQSVLEYALIGTIKATEREYQAAFRELVPLDYSGLLLEGEQPDALRGSWEDLQQAESSLLAALAQYPSNIYLNGKLLDLRSQQLQFVKRMALLEQNNWRRT